MKLGKAQIPTFTTTTTGLFEIRKGPTNIVLL